jgi:restriction system protein
LTEYLSIIFYHLENSGLCVSEYCYSYLLAIPLFAILLLSLKRRKYIPDAKKKGGFSHLTWQQMEFAAREYYKSKGFLVKSHGGASADGGVDLIAKKRGRSILVQVKHYKGKVGVKIVREMLGVLVDDSRFNEVHIITSSSFTRPALDLAKRHKIQLIGKSELIA